MGTLEPYLIDYTAHFSTHLKENTLNELLSIINSAQLNPTQLIDVLSSLFAKVCNNVHKSVTAENAKVPEPRRKANPLTADTILETLVNSPLMNDLRKDDIDMPRGHIQLSPVASVISDVFNSIGRHDPVKTKLLNTTRMLKLSVSLSQLNFTLKPVINFTRPKRLIYEAEDHHDIFAADDDDYIDATHNDLLNTACQSETSVDAILEMGVKLTANPVDFINDLVSRLGVPTDKLALVAARGFHSYLVVASV